MIEEYLELARWHVAEDERLVAAQRRAMRMLRSRRADDQEAADTLVVLLDKQAAHVADVQRLERALLAATKLGLPEWRRRAIEGGRSAHCDGEG